MKKILVILATLTFFWVEVGQAHGPSRVKVEESIEIDAAPEAVWGKIKDFDKIHTWLPLVEKTTAKGGNEKGATRTLTLKDGATISEKLKKYEEEKMTYSYKITDMSTVKTIKHSGADVEVKVLPVANYKAWLSVEAGKSGGSLVTWKAKFYRGYMKNDPPAEMNEDAAKKAVTEVFKTGLTNLNKVVGKGS